MVNHLLFQVNIAYLFSFPAKSILAGGICCGIGRWLIFMINYYQSVRHGKNSLRIFTNNGYDVEINEISPNIKIPFYKINGELFYNYAPFARDISVMLSGIKKIAKHAEPKNIVINLVDSSVDFEKLVQRLVANFSNKFNKIIIINKPQNIITIKDGNWLSINPQYLLYQCPCCGEHTLNRPGKEETCSVCGWIDDPLQSLDPDYKNGFNKISLNEAIAVNQKNFKKEIK